MSYYETLRDGGELSIAILDLRHQKAMQEWTEACSLWGMTNPCQGFSEAEARGEQPDELALPVDGALRGEPPLSGTERSEV
jgi:hypothetical protein